MKQGLNKLGWKKKSRGETILEVLAALVVVTIGAATASSLIVTSLKANLFNKDSLIALNLAQEGLEYMRNLRDSNWIKFSSNTQGCWNMKPGVESCLPTNALAEAVGTAGYVLGDKLGDSVVSSKLDLTDGVTTGTEAAYRVNYFDLNQTVDSDSLDRKDSGNLAKERDDYDFMGSSSSSGIKVDDSKFYRSIEVDYKKMGDGNPRTINESNDTTQGDIMIVTSTVQWKDGATVHQAKLSSALSRYK